MAAASAEAASMARRFSRRIMVHHLAFMGGGVVLLGGCQKPTQNSPEGQGSSLTTSHRTFTSEEYRVMSAAVDRVLPKDQDAGALDAQVPEYIDRMLQSPELQQMKEDFVTGTAALNRRSKRLLGKPFFEAAPEQQDEVLRIFRDSKPGSGEAHYYETLVVLTLEGFLGDPSYGGNKDKVGWALVGFNVVGTHAMEPPMGHDGMRALHAH